MVYDDETKLIQRRLDAISDLQQLFEPGAERQRDAGQPLSRSAPKTEGRPACAERFQG